jgi:hypothetical protein
MNNNLFIFIVQSRSDNERQLVYLIANKVVPRKYISRPYEYNKFILISAGVFLFIQAN